MSIQHPGKPPTDATAFVFAAMGGFTCSICAPATLSRFEIEAVAEMLVPRLMGPWRAVDTSLPPISIGGKTPNPCSQDPSRLHWFLISEDEETRQ